MRAGHLALLGMLGITLFAAISGCASGPRVQPQTADVHLEIIARVLARSDELASHASGGAAARAALRTSLVDAHQSLLIAERGVEAWRHGDPRGWTRIKPCLAEDLARVDAALDALGMFPPPGLTEIVPASPLDPCADESYRSRAGAR